MKKKFRFLWLLLIGIPILLGLFFLALTGYRFSAMLSFGASGIAALYYAFGQIPGSFAWWLRLIVTILLIIVFILGIITGIYIGKAATGSTEECDYVIVLGAAVHGTVPSLSLRERLDATNAYLTQHPDTICVVSGGQGSGEDITEADCMSQYLINKGIDPGRILLEDKATSTQENIRYSLDLIETITGVRPQRAGIVSSEYHLYRAGRIAKSQSLEAVGIPATTRIISLRINYFLREIAGVWYNIVFGG